MQVKEVFRGVCNAARRAALVGALAVLAACGGHSHGDAANGATPPANLSYGTPVALYVTTEPIPTNLPQYTGGPVAAFSITPALPAGLDFNTQTGAITGTPTAITAQATHTVTASNAAGSVSTQVKVEVTARGSWAAAGTITPGRLNPIVVKLLNGRVLVAGGSAAGAVFDVTELYDPVANTWITAAPMLDERTEHTATLLQDGRVLVVGGKTTIAGAATATAELYDPAANTWTATGSLNQARMAHTATALPDGSVLVIGGHGPGAPDGSDTVERYNPATGAWTVLTTRLTTARFQHAAQLLPGGAKILVVGGVGAGGVLSSYELFPVNDIGPSVASAGGPTGNPLIRAVPLADGSVLVVGDQLAAAAAAQRYHPATDTWVASTPLVSRIQPSLTLLADGRALLAGGSNLASAEIYNPGANAWTAAGSMAIARRATPGVLLNDGTVLVVGGTNGGGEVNTAERYSP
jgi:hypothetical protein